MLELVVPKEPYCSNDSTWKQEGLAVAPLSHVPPCLLALAHSIQITDPCHGTGIEHADATKTTCSYEAVVGHSISCTVPTPSAPA